MEGIEELRSLLQSVADGDRWMDAEACAFYIAATSKRAFLERIACLPDFPREVRIRNHPRWKKSEVDAWMEKQRS